MTPMMVILFKTLSTATKTENTASEWITAAVIVISVNSGVHQSQKYTCKEVYQFVLQVKSFLTDHFQYDGKFNTDVIESQTRD